MTVYQNSSANLGVKLEITHASPDIANNRTTITYKASVYKTGSHNPYNLLSQTPMYLTINGQSLYSTSSGNYDLRGSKYEQTIKSGTLVIPHNSDGSKSFSFSWNANFTSTGYGYGNVTTSGTYVLPNIARASTFTIPSTTITTGSAFTVTINKASDGFRHKVAYIVGSSTNEWITNANTSYSATVPHELFNAHKSTDSISGVIRVTTMNGSSVVGSSQRAVTINLASSAIPKLGSTTYSNSDKGMFSGANQFIRGISRATVKANTPEGSYSSSISTYEFRYRRGTTYSNITSKTTDSHQFDAFSFPDSGSENGVYFQARVRDSRGRYSAWKETSDIRVHYYQPPVLGTMTVRRVGSTNTTLQVTRNYSVTSMYELGTGSNINTASLRFQHRTKGSTDATDSTGAKSTTTSLSDSNANLSGTFAAGTSYEVRAILSDKLNTIYGSWISVGTEFVPMDIAPKGVGVGKIHSNGGYNLEVGSGGINSEGPMIVDGVIQEFHKSVIGDDDPSIIAASGAARIAEGHSSLPAGANWSQMLTIHGGGDTISQMVFPYQDTGNPWVRSGNPPAVGGSGSYGDWKKLAFTSDIPSIPTITSGTNDNGNWCNINGVLLICWRRFSITGRLTDSQMNGTWTYPMPFAFAPAVSIGSRADNDPSSNNSYRRDGSTAFHQYNESTTKTDILYAVNNGDVPSDPEKYLNIFAIGTPA